ncbi:MAG: DUF2062 domain-containing protein [Alphaproteobacteria bacterium]|nr:MAG: DUF2062 domain-containing protein [Alphaproteobacteria bacterium]
MDRERKRKERLWRWMNYLWPRMGLRRYLVYLSHRIGRLPGTAHSIAAGIASGAAISMTPFVGFHFLLAALLAWVVRGNILASAIGTIIGNPWTFPLIWIWTYRIGCWLMARDPVADPLHHLSMTDAFREPAATLGPLLLPMMAGSLPVAIVVWFGIYWPLRGAVGKYKERRIERRHRRAIALIKRLEGDSEEGKRNDAA